MNKLHKLVMAISLVAFMFSSCIDLDVDPQYHADAFVLVTKVDGDTIYAIDAMVKCNYGMDTVTISNANKSWVRGLKKFDYFGTWHELNPDFSSYVTERIPAETYTFNVKLSDSTKTSLTNQVPDIVLNPFDLKEIEFDEATQSHMVSWNECTNANYYAVRIFKNQSFVLNTDFFSSNYKSLQVKKYNSYWQSNFVPQNGDTLVVEVLAILMEANSSDKFQCISMAPRDTLIWGLQ